MGQNTEILQHLNSSDMSKKILALSKLTQTEDEKLIEKIISLLDDTEIRVRGEVFSTLFLN